MNIKRFFGKNAREALAQVKQALGEDAIIIANRSVNGGTEIMAMLESEVEARPATQAGQQPPAQPISEHERTLLDYVAHKGQPITAALSASKPSPSESPLQQRPQAEHLPQAATAAESDIVNLLKHHSEEQAQAYQLATKTVEEKMQDMMQEMRHMRQHVEAQMSSMTWQHHLQNNPAKSKVLSTLLAASFSAALSRQIAEKLPAHIDVHKAAQWAKEIIARNLLTLDDDQDLLERGGIFALVGPTGVGKTTTTAKLAARYAMQYGTQNLGLITTDSYRIGGYEQLRIYGKILGVMVHAVKDEDDLKIALKELKNKHMILVDTVGVSQRDQAVAEQLSMLNHTDAPIQKLLCLNATSTGETLTDVMRSYQQHAISGCIVTKLDEAAAIGNVLDVLIRERMRLCYTTSGQRVPEDIQVADKQALINRVLTPSKASWPYQYLEEELPLVIGNLQAELVGARHHV